MLYKSETFHFVGTVQESLYDDTLYIGPNSVNTDRALSTAVRQFVEPFAEDECVYEFVVAVEVSREGEEVIQDGVASVYALVHADMQPKNFHPVTLVEKSYTGAVMLVGGQYMLFQANGIPIDLEIAAAAALKDGVRRNTDGEQIAVAIRVWFELAPAEVVVLA